MSDNQGEQLPLFFDQSDETPDLTNIAWSYSRRETLEQCTRRYYYEYYGASKRFAKQHPVDEQVRFLKRLQSRYLRAGDLLHLAIRTYFRKAQEGRTSLDPDRLVRWACDIFQGDQSYSRTNPTGEFIPQEDYPPVLLREYYYRLPDADALCVEEEKRLANSLYAFATASEYEQFRVAGSRANTEVEKQFSLQGQYCRIGGKVDLAYSDADGVTIVDWKLGAANSAGEESLQLAVYGLWAMHHFGCTSDALHVFKVHLSSGEIVSFRADSRVLAEAQARIAQDAERMAVLHRYGEQGVVDVFTPCWHSAICHLCSFERLCYA